MSHARFLLLMGSAALLFSCGRTLEHDDTVLAEADSSLTGVERREKERLEKVQALEEERLRDSLALDKILQKALKVAGAKGHTDTFRTSYAECMLDSSYQVDVSIHNDFHFSNERLHLIIKMSEPSAVHINIYTNANDGYTPVLAHEQWTMTYVNDTVQDINGDRLQDVVVNWYGATGCCLKAFSKVYLQRPDHTFSSDLEFINPTFSPSEQMIRGVCYGHPGETELYKYRWHGETVDTLEYVHYEKDAQGTRTGKVILSTALPYGEGYKVLCLLDAVPQEYRKIEGYDWFTGTGYE